VGRGILEGQSGNMNDNIDNTSTFMSVQMTFYKFSIDTNFPSIEVSSGPFLNKNSAKGAIEQRRTKGGRAIIDV
jgi:hypothetical protein